MTAYQACVAITTHNRKELLGECVDSCLAQSLGDRLQVLVVDDGSTDGTTEHLRAMYGDRPNVKIVQMSPGIGMTAARSRFGDLVDAPIIVSIDDDAIFPSPTTVEQTIEQFTDPRIGAIAIPYIDVLKEDKSVRQLAPDESTTWVASQFRGTAFAIRVDLFNRIGRFRDRLWRQNEEADLCIRMLNAGGFVALGRADPIHHVESPKRSRPEIIFASVRNWYWVIWLNAPARWIVPQLTVATWNFARHAVMRPERLRPTLRGMWHGIGGILGAERRRREPVSPGAYRTFMRLRRGKPMPIDAAAEMLGMESRS